MKRIYNVTSSPDSDKAFITRASNIVEALWNLTYLICEDADRPEKVRQYASLCEERLQALTALLQTQRAWQIPQNNSAIHPR
jgi:hypothetical protein